MGSFKLLQHYKLITFIELKLRKHASQVRPNCCYLCLLESSRRRSRCHIFSRPQNWASGSVPQESGRRYCQEHPGLERTENYSRVENSEQTSYRLCCTFSTSSYH